jgi:hypothetical protein
MFITKFVMEHTQTSTKWEVVVQISMLTLLHAQYSET